jgi:hypothetical protein
MALPYSHGQALMMENSGRCVALAVAESQYRRFQHWNGRTLIVHGLAFRQPALDSNSGAILMWYLVRDRRISVGVCSTGSVIYVDHVLKVG